LEGAATIVWCAVNSQLDGKGGVYCENVDIAEAVSAENSDPSGDRGLLMRNMQSNYGH